jgi:hypothetical protein
MHDDTKETIIQLVTLAAVVVVSLLTRRDMRIP